MLFQELRLRLRMAEGELLTRRGAGRVAGASRPGLATSTAQSASTRAKPGGRSGGRPDVIPVEDMRVMDAEEPLRVEAGHERAQGVAWWIAT